MSRIVDKSDLTDAQIAYLYKTAKITELKTPFKPFPKPIKLWGFDNKSFWFPASLPLPGKTFREYHNLKKYRAKFNVSAELYSGPEDPSGLNRDQTTIYSHALDNLANHGSAFLHLSTGFGKSVVMTKLAQALERKTVIFVFSTTLQKEVFNMLKTKTDAVVFHYNGSKLPPPNSQIDIIGLKKASKLSIKFLSRYQTVFIDEVDQLPAKGTLPLMKKIAPDYLIGLTATIERSDGLHTALYKYWGEKKYFISRFIVKPDATIIKYQTNFIPEIEYDAEGNIRNDILNNSIGNNKDRHRCIEKLVRSLYPQKMLILSDRTEEIVSLYEKLKDLDCDYKTGKKKDMDKKHKILIGGYKSCGRGYDVPGLEVVILLTSFRNVKQYEGRLRSECGVVYDFVDCAPILEARWKTRLTWYKKRNMKIKYQIDGMDEVRDYQPTKSKKTWEEVDILGNM